MIKYVACTLAFVLRASAAQPDQDARSISLTVKPGVPLRLYLTKRIPKRMGAPVEAKLLAPVYSFDREVLPAGTAVLGHISTIEAVSKWERVRAVLGGDFTPLHIAKVEFTSLVLADGRQMSLQTSENAGLNSLFAPVTGKRRANPPSAPQGVLGRGKRAIQDQVNAQLARVRSIPEMVRGPDRKELLYDFAMSKLPYHPQYVRNKTRFDAELLAPLNFGPEMIPASALNLFGSQPASGVIAHARLLTSLDSSISKPGEKVEAIFTEPLFSADGKLILPEGTRVEGSVVLAKKAGWFHHGGRLRFTFSHVDLPLEFDRLAPNPGEGFKTEAILNGAESGKAPFKVDQEGGVQATESKTRFIKLAAALVVASSAGDTDSERNVAGTAPKSNSNIAGRTLGGGLGFGLLGSIAAQSSPTVGAVLGYYGLAWSVFTNLVAHGAEVQFPSNAVIDITFNTRLAAKNAP